MIRTATPSGEQGGARLGTRRRARAARLVGGDGVSGDGHALKNTVSRTGKTVRRVRRSSSTDARWLEREFESDDGSVVCTVRARTRSAFAPAIRATTTRSRQTRAQVRARFERVRVVSQRTRRHRRRSLLGARRTREQTVGVRADVAARRRASARKTRSAHARSGPPRGLTLTQRLAAGGAAVGAGALHGADRSARLGRTRADSVAAPPGRSGRSGQLRRGRNAITLQNARDTSYLSYL